MDNFLKCSKTLTKRLTLGPTHYSKILVYPASNYFHSYFFSPNSDFKIFCNLSKLFDWITSNKLARFLLTMIESRSY